MPFIEISEIVIPAGQLKPVDVQVVKLAESIEAVGLQSPIKLRRNDAGKMVLVFGYKRLHAHKHLKRTQIEYTLFEGNEQEAELVHLDENLARTDLTGPERMVLASRRWEAWQAVKEYRKGRPAKAAAEPPKKGENAEMVSNDTILSGNENNDLILGTPATRRAFVADTAAVMGVSESTINRDLATMANLTPDGKAATMDAAAVEVVAMAQLPADAQQAAVKAIRAGVPVAQAVAARKTTTPKPPPDTVAALAKRLPLMLGNAKSFAGAVGKVGGALAEWEALQAGVNELLGILSGAEFEIIQKVERLEMEGEGDE